MSIQIYQPLSPELGLQFGIIVPTAFRIPATFCERFLQESGLKEPLDELYGNVDPSDPNDVMIRSFRVRKLLERVALPESMESDLWQSCQSLFQDGDSLELVLYQEGKNPLDGSSRFKGAKAFSEAIQKSYLDHLTHGLLQRYEDDSFDYLRTAPTLLVQAAPPTQRSGLALSFEPVSQAQSFVVVFSAWGLAEDIVRRSVARDEFIFHKAALQAGRSRPVFSRCGAKEFQLQYDAQSHRLEHLPLSRVKGRASSLNARQALALARCLQHLEKERGHALELSWSGSEENLYLLNVREIKAPAPNELRLFRQVEQGEILLQGQAVGHSVASGRVRLLRGRDDLDDFQSGEVLVAHRTEPDWEPAFRKAAAIVTQADRRVSHATILAREMGIPAILQAEDCTSRLKDGQMVTVSCCRKPQGLVFAGQVKHDMEQFSLQKMPDLKTKLMVNLSMPEQALSVAQLPWAGAGLVRSEFMIGSWVKVHPLALLCPEKLSQDSLKAVERICYGYQDGEQYFLSKMSQAIGLIAAAFHPRPITLRLSDFKSDEYARLLGGEVFEPKEHNSLLGWRGASRYLHPDYREAFKLELAAVKSAREELGFDNIKLMVPFCRTPEEGEEVLDLMAREGLKSGENGLQIWTMAELPSNVLLAEEFADVFDGMSIGSSDLTGLTLGVDRNSDRLSEYFDELHPALMKAYEMVISACHQAQKEVSFCGQIASEDVEFAALLVEMEVDSLSLAPDALHSTLERLNGGF